MGIRRKFFELVQHLCPQFYQMQAKVHHISRAQEAVYFVLHSMTVIQNWHLPRSCKRLLADFNMV